MATGRRTLTGSALDRAEACPASAVLPQLPDREGRAAIAGSKVHTQLEERSDELRERLLDTGDDLDELYPEGGVHEALVWYDPVSRSAGWEPKPRGTHRDYDKFPADVLVGTIDFLHPTLGMVADLKTGIYPPKPDGLQNGLAEVALATQEGLKEVTVSVDQLLPKRPMNRMEARHSEDELLGQQARLDGLYAHHLLNRARVQAGHEPTKNPSQYHCRWCRADCDKRWTR